MINNLLSQIDERIAYLEEIINKKRKELVNVPEGFVRASKHGNGYQYFIRKAEDSKNGRYVSKKRMKEISRIVQGEYDAKILENAEKELLALVRTKKAYINGTIEDIYDKMQEGKKIIVKPIIETEKDFADKVLKNDYERLPFMEDYPEYYSANGIRVRSKSEVIIADLLEKLDVPFVYERPIKLKGNKTLYPDFTLIDIKRRKLIILEHFGLMDDEGYCNNAIKKIELYEENGFKLGESLIASFETSHNPLNIKKLEKKIEAVCTVNVTKQSGNIKADC